MKAERGATEMPPLSTMCMKTQVVRKNSKDFR